MDVKQRYIREAGYDVGEDFIETIQTIDLRTAIKIATFISKERPKLKTNLLVSSVLAGVIIDDYNKPITFAVELIKTNDPYIILSDLKFISMDEYLDLYNINKKINLKSKKVNYFFIFVTIIVQMFFN